VKFVDRIGDALERVRPAPRVPAARKRGLKAEALQGRGSVARSKLQQERDELAREFVELQWDLGGIAYEMASRDHFRLDVLSRQAAKLQHVDSALGQAERMLRLGEEGVGGTCPSCGGVQARAAIYCWQCGKELTPATAPPPAIAAPPAAAPAPQVASGAQTEVLPAEPVSAQSAVASEPVAEPHADAAAAAGVRS